ncbi:MAG: TerB family tellurite resistance protein, partial [Nitrospiria bacterium]
MAWWGTGVGASIGLIFGGPIGAIIGAGLGSSLTQDKAQLGTGQQKQIGFLVAAFTMLGKIAKADGFVSPDEVEFIDTFMTRELELDARSRKVAIEIFNRAKSDETSIYKYAQQFSEIFRNDAAMRETIYRVLFMTAMADGHLHPAEKEILQKLPIYLHIKNDAYHRFESAIAGDNASSG